MTISKFIKKIYSIFYIQLIMNQVLMFDQSLESELMQLISNGNNHSEIGLFQQVLKGDNQNFQFYPSKNNLQVKEDDLGLNQSPEVNHITQVIDTQIRSAPILTLEEKCQQRCFDQKDSKKSSGRRKNNFKNFKDKSEKRVVMSTNCHSLPAKQQVQINQDVKNSSSLVDFTNINNETQQSHSKQFQKDQKKMRSKISKFIFKQKSFGKALKISFPKKIVQMFLNHYEAHQIDNQEVKIYNDNLKQKLKKSKKNDYTFEKEVSQILGECKDSQVLQDQSEQTLKLISQMNRKVVSQIIHNKMKQQVIMRDKIAKNRQLYMIQLKVYALRCRSHKLSKKGTYK